MERIDLQLVITAIIGVGIYWLLTSGLIGWAWDEIMTWREDRLADRWERQQFVMSPEEARENESVFDPVSIPVLDTSISTAGMESAAPAAPDIDAQKPFDRDITANEWIVLMACARNEEKKHRFSANQIHTAVGGDRNTVLAKIKEIRSGPPTPEFRQDDGTTAPASRPVTGQRRPA